MALRGDKAFPGHAGLGLEALLREGRDSASTAPGAFLLVGYEDLKIEVCAFETETVEGGKVLGDAVEGEAMGMGMMDDGGEGGGDHGGLGEGGGQL
ncbi:hypothetical protein D0Z07_5783 [Hyphodiscus hymeniophilus]|uniref:Uncharacterized protein n=1 Tax=Hyphodiscus hymeniophilus TaxID=353542 RepID=A0A9P6VH76_9HELO|nr:hypothetical protein D0Z07_5783 [Hyphodiscus hymeniophilus]